MSDLATLFSRDPNKYSRQDVDAIIAAYRAKRSQFNLGGSLAGKVKPTSPKAAAAAKLIAGTELDL